MRKSLLKICVGLALVSATASSGLAAPAMKTLSGHVPAAISRLQPAGLFPADTNLNLAIGLPLRNQEALASLQQQLYDPASPNYHHFLTPEQFTAQFGPTEQDYQKVVSFAQASGLTVTRTHGNRMLVDVSGKAADIGKAFQVKLRTYHHPSEKRDFFAPDTNPTVDATLPILHVSGLENYSLPHPLLHKLPVPQAKPALGSGPFGSYMGYDFRNAYVPGTGLTGSGQMVGLVQFNSGFYQSDITAYETQAGLPNVPVQPVLLDGYGGGLGDAPDEVSLDIEMVISMAPGVSQVLVFEGEITDDILNAMAASNQVKQLSASWSYNVDPTTEQIFQQFAVQGQSFFNASGDWDAWTGWGLVFSPCDDPHITIVGGTTLSTANSNWVSETVWNWGVEYGDDGIGSGGGYSYTYAIPSWQTNISMTANMGSTTMRNLPDVALTADNVWVIYGGGFSGAYGGTSCASPLWAGFMALVNQQAAANGIASPGFINPAIYAIATGPNYLNCFHDITTGNNTWSASPNLFYAVTNYDLCTGLGTPNGTNLINALAGVGNSVTHLSPPPPPFGTNLAAMNGSNPNGAWSLFIQDDRVIDSGVISNGWVLALTTANPVGAAADNELLMTNLSSTSIVVGGTVAFSLTVTNYGPTASTNVQVRDTMPSGFTLVSSNGTLGSVISAGSVVIWYATNKVVVLTNNYGVITTNGVLTTNAGGQLTLVMRAGNNTGSFNNYASVIATTPDPNPDDDSPFMTVNVSGTPQPVQFGNFVFSNGAFQFTITGQPGQEYLVQASSNLVNWVPVYTNPPPYNSPFTYTNSSAASHPALFYRVVGVPPWP